MSTTAKVVMALTAVAGAVIGYKAASWIFGKLEVRG
jgi:hypothetical protein